MMLEQDVYVLMHLSDEQADTYVRPYSFYEHTHVSGDGALNAEPPDMQ